MTRERERAAGAAALPVRQPPFDRDAEAAVLGALMLDTAPEVFDEVAARLAPEDFYVEAHRLLYRAIQAVHAAGSLPDLVTLTDQLRRDGSLERLGGVAWLVGLVDGVGTSAYVHQYADVVVEKARLRRIISASAQAMQQAYDLEDADAVAEALEARLLSLAAGDALPVVSAEAAVGEALALVQQYLANRGRPVGVTTGLKDLDRVVSGLQKGRLYVLAARPSMGKSALALQMALAAASAGVGAAFFSLEMSVSDLTERALAARARVDLQRIREGTLSERDHQRLADAAGPLAALPWHVVDTAELDVRGLRVAARRLVNRQGVGLIVVDYLQLMKASLAGRESENRVQEVSVITRGLKVLARELDVPVLALSQLSRQVESRADKRPMLSDLRESGSIEQDADVVLFLYRDEYYDPNSAKLGVAEVIVAKQRSGPTGTVEVAWSAPHARFGDLARHVGGVE